MPGALEALDTILHGRRRRPLTAPEAIEQLLAAQNQLRNDPGLPGCNALRRLPVVSSCNDFDFHLPAVAPARADRKLHELPASSRLPERLIFLGHQAWANAPRDQSRHRGRPERTKCLLRARLAIYAPRSKKPSAARRLQARLKVLTHPAVLVVDEIRLSANQSHRRHALFSADDASVRARVDRAHVQQGLRGVGDIFGDDSWRPRLIERIGPPLPSRHHPERHATGCAAQRAVQTLPHSAHRAEVQRRRPRGRTPARQEATTT